MLKLAKSFVMAAAVLAGSAAMGETEISGKVSGKLEGELRVKMNKTATLEDVTLAGNLVMENRTDVRVNGTLKLEGGKILMATGAETSFETVLNLAKGAEISGKGVIEFRGGKTRNRVVTLEDKSPTVFGPEVTLSGAGGGGQFRSLKDAPMRFEGTVVVGPSPATMTFEGPMTIVGRLKLEAGAEAAILELTNLSAGTLTGGNYWLKDGTLRVKEAIETNAATLWLDNTKVLVGEKGTENLLKALKKNAASGIISITGAQRLVQGPPRFAAKFLNEGELRISGWIEAETLINKGTVRMLFNGLKGRLENSGTLELWTSTMDGDLVLEDAGRLTTRIRDGGCGNLIMNTGTVSAGGTLEVTPEDGYVPPIGAKFQVFDGKIVGKFARFVLPKLPAGRGWSVEHLYDEGILEVVAGTGNVPAEVAASLPAEEVKLPEKRAEKPGLNWILYIVGVVVVAIGAALWGWRRGRRAAK
jgi:hypothetical protein